jgi:hypothetical protein
MVENTRKFLFTAILVIFIALTAFGTYLFLVAPKKITLSKTEIDTSGLDEIDYLSPDVNGRSLFLTGKAKSIGTLNESKPIITQLKAVPGDFIVDAIWYGPKKNKLLMTLVNDPEQFVGMNNYQSNQEDTVFATYNTESKNLEFLPNGVTKTFVLGDKVYGEINSEIKALRGNTWDSTKVKGYEQLIINPEGFGFATRSGNQVKVYDETAKEISEYKVKTTDYNNIYLFNNGALGELLNKKEVLIHSKRASKTINVGAKEQLLVTGDGLYYSSGANRLNLYIPSTNKIYYARDFGLDLSYLYLKPLSKDKIFYTDITNFKTYLLQLNGLK